MIELDPTLRLVIAFAITIIGSGVILPAYIIHMRKSRIKDRRFAPRLN